MSDSSNCARARLISSCMNNSSSIRASFLASAGRDRARRRSSMASRVFRCDPPAVWHCLATVSGNARHPTKRTHDIDDKLDQDLFHHIHRVARRIPVISKTIHEVFDCVAARSDGVQALQESGCTDVLL